MSTAKGEMILLRHRDIQDIDNLEIYRQNGGFEAYRKAVASMSAEEVTNVVKASGLRGRGGAGFPTGMKWSFIDNKSWPHYVVANADESEPGTFKDREIMESNPYQFLEGVAICAYAIGAHTAYIYLRGEFWQVAEKLDQHIAAMGAAGLLGDGLFGTDYSLQIYTHLGAGRKPPCWNPLRANWDSRVYARPSRLPMGSSASQP
jgi:NADH-quinone oxidoreductase subunit F